MSIRFNVFRSITFFLMVLLPVSPVFGQVKSPSPVTPKPSPQTMPTVSFFDDQNQPVSLKHKIEPYFATNSEQAEVFYFKLSMKLGKDIDSVALAQGSLLQKNKDIAHVLLSGLNDTMSVKFADTMVVNYKVALKFQKVELINRNCNTQSFAINIPNLKENFYIAASCKDIKGSIQASISIPQELSWGPSTVFETAGKGERWKLFNFNQLNLSNKSGEIGRITVLKEGVQAPCLITFLPGLGPGTQADKVSESKIKRKTALVRLAMGVSQQSVKNEDMTGSGLGYLLGFDGKYFPEKNRWVLNGKYKNVLSTSNEGQALSLFQAGVGYLFGKEFGNGFSFVGLANFDSFSSQAPKVKVNVVHSQVGFSFLMFKFDEKIRKGWFLDLFFSGYLPKAESQIMGLEFQYLFGSEGIGKGIFFNFLSENFEFKKSTTSDLKSIVQSSQIQTGLVLHF